MSKVNNKDTRTTSMTKSLLQYNTAQKMRFSIKYFFSKCDQTRSILRIWSHLLKKSLMENFIIFAQCKLLSNEVAALR